MNDQSQLMNQPPPPPMMMSQPPPPQQMMSQPLPQMMSAPPSSQQMMMNNAQSQPLMMNRSYNKQPWPQQQFSGQKPPQQQHGRNNNNNNNWKGKKGNSDKRKNSSIGGQSSSGGGYNNNNNNNVIPNLPLSGGLNSTLGYNITNMSLSGGQSVTGGYNVPNLPLNSGGQSSYKPPTLNELQSQNRMKARKFYPNRKKYNNRFAPYAPRNTTSFIIRAKKSGGIASLVSPYPVTPAVLPTPIFSPSREVLGDTAKEEWGVDGYGSMKGLIRLRSPGNDDEEEEGGGGGSSESDVEEHVEVERRLDHDLSRFEMIYPNYSGVEYNNVLENRVDDQDTHIAQLEEENLTLKERLFLMERELGDLRRRMLFLERRHHVMEEVNEEVVENGSENESDGGSDVPHMGISGDEYASRDVGARDVSMEEYVHDETNLKGNEGRDEVRNELVADGVVSEKVEEARNELIMNKENANKTEALSCEVETKNENEFMEGQVNIEEAEGKNETGVMRNDVENKIENEMMQTNADKDEEMGTSCALNINEAMKNEGETKV